MPFLHAALLVDYFTLVPLHCLLLHIIVVTILQRVPLFCRDAVFAWWKPSSLPSTLDKCRQWSTRPIHRWHRGRWHSHS